ncbi:MAG: hypothetical protein IRY95_02325, partial [Clostridia bacterium]|nr:hypothetical protein [Clostridia bacterium]
EREVFSPWGEEADRSLLSRYQRSVPPRATFRAGRERGELLFKFPQLVDPVCVYRLNDAVFRLPHPEVYEAVLDVRQELRLTTERAVAVLRPVRGDWRVTVYRSEAEEDADSPTTLLPAVTPEEAEAALDGASGGRFWQLTPGRRRTGLVIAR